MLRRVLTAHRRWWRLITDDRAGVVVPDVIQAGMRTCGSLPGGGDLAVLTRFLHGYDPQTAPDDEHLVDAALLWIAGMGVDHAALHAWSDYAFAATQRLHGEDHPQTRRAALARAATSTGILTISNRDEVARAVADCITDATGMPGDDDHRLGDHLSAAAGLHALGRCDHAIGNITRILPRWSDDCYDLSGRQSLLVVGLAILTACGRHTDARHLLEHHHDMLPAAHTPDRDLFAECALSVMDTLTGPHPPVCTAPSQPGDPAYRRQQWSAWLHGEHPDTHLNPTAAQHANGTAVPGTALSYLPIVSDLPRLFEKATRRDQPRLPARPGPTTESRAGEPADVYLTCTTCRLALLLGVTTTPPDQPSAPLPPVTLDGQPAWHHPGLRLLLWTVLAEHRGHDLRVTLNAADTAPPLVPRTIAPPARVGQDDYYACLICRSCRLELILGDVTTHPETPGTATITQDGQPCHLLTIPTTAVFRLLTDHPGCHLAVITDEDTWSQYLAAGGWSHTIHAGPETNRDFGDIDHRQYIHGWPTRPSRPRYYGFDPVTRPHPIPAAAHG